MAQASTSRLLLCELADFIRQGVAGYPFPDPSGGMLDCRVYLHGAPEDQDDNVYPFVIIRWLEGDVESMDDGQTILRDTVGLVLGVHSPHSQAEAGLLCAELLDCLRRMIWKKRLLAQRFELVEPLRASIPGIKQEVHRFHMATIETVWNYVWPPKALEEAGMSQMKTIAPASSYSREILEQNSIY